ncbi:hypothetical protein BZA05DRAFT_353744 [Tricharina praecox]|uniref:uncharacterized protein n=1 Tax=Tricharina praecox TaxID=43433 RepID=UPI00221F1CFC|nr:uncharacterized protein BZA05DRAFT_353744 [Tricharina praecox]KAI5850854.1 hypothetical protein BZA05DRAFT_353744 [Tricharina praecox]
MAPMMITFLLLLVIPSGSVVAAADDGDDMSNNLFSDLAPLLTLFGEQFAKQYLSQSMNWLDNVIFAMAPLGIITAIVGAIRVGGPSWLKALIGRARENRATVEVELMSSTSHEVCELWNGQGIIRTMGRPEIKQIIYLKSADGTDTGETFGLHTVESAMQAGHLEARAPDLNNVRLASNIGGPQAAPSISLNLHGGNKVSELYAAAICGLVLQVGVLFYCGALVYLPALLEKLPKDGVGSWPFPVLATGTIALFIGMFLCSGIVEKSTKETAFMLKHHDDTPQPETVRILWLQTSHIVSDQTFDSFVIFGKHESDRILTSRRDNDLDPQWIASFENVTVFGTSFGLAGFVLQFQGLRGMNWSASIAQLIAVSLMTVWRAWLRRYLTETPIPRQVPAQHEMDWLALWMAKKLGDDESGGIHWPADDEVLG